MTWKIPATPKTATRLKRELSKAAQAMRQPPSVYECLSGIDGPVVQTNVEPLAKARPIRLALSAGEEENGR